MLNHAATRLPRRRYAAALDALLLALLLAATPAHAELGWSRADYAKQVGPATGSPMTPDQVRFTSARGDSVLVRFADGHSREELWSMGDRTDSIPAALVKEAQAAVKGTPARRVAFQLARTPAAEIFEVRATEVTVQVDQRAGRIVRIGRCRNPDPCVLLDQLLAMERATDDLLARTEQQLRQQGK